nr:hypothetical protein [Jannaschia donghaensis]
MILYDPRQPCLASCDSHADQIEKPLSSRFKNVVRNASDVGGMQKIDEVARHLPWPFLAWKPVGTSFKPGSILAFAIWSVEGVYDTASARMRQDPMLLARADCDKERP